MTLTIKATSTGEVTRKYLRPDELAQRWGVAPKTLAKWRSDGSGPHYVKLSGGLVRYPVDDIETFELAIGEE